MKVVLNLIKKRLKKLRILVLYEKDPITETFLIKFKVILPLMSVIICVLVYNLYYCCYAKTSSSAVQKRNSKVYGNPINRPLLLFYIFLCTFMYSIPDYLIELSFLLFLFKKHMPTKKKYKREKAKKICY